MIELKVVVPGYYLVWYNLLVYILLTHSVVVPGYYLVWYNNKAIVALINRS